MPSLKLNPQCGRIIHKLGPLDAFRRTPVLDPRHHRRQHIRVGVEPACCCASAALAENPRPRPAAAVLHARDAEEAVPRVQRRRAAVSGQALVEALAVEAGDLLVLPAVVHDGLAAARLEAPQRRWVGANVARVGVLAGLDGGKAKLRHVPAGIVGHCVAVVLLARQTRVKAVHQDGCRMHRKKKRTTE